VGRPRALLRFARGVERVALVGHAAGGLPGRYRAHMRGPAPTRAHLPNRGPLPPSAFPLQLFRSEGCAVLGGTCLPVLGRWLCVMVAGVARWFSQASRRVVSRHRALREIVFGRCGAAAAAAPDCCPLKVPLLPSPQPSCFPFYLIGVHSTMTPRSPHRRFFRVPIRAIGTGARGSGLPRAFFSLSPCGRAASPPTWHKHPCRRFLLSSAGRT